MGVPSIVDQSNRIRSRGEEYIVFFYVGQIPADAVSALLLRGTLVLIEL